MANRLQNKVALITAAGQGIGRAIAESFIAEGARVIATDVEESKLEGLKSLQRRKLDVRSTEAVEALAKEVAAEFGALGILVNCAGYVHHGSVLDCSEKDWDFSFDLNVKSIHRTIKAFLPAMLAKKAGSIVNISSAVSSIRGVPDRYAYGASKAAIIGLTKAVAADLSGKASARTPSAPAPSSRRHSRAASRTARRRPANRCRRSSAPSSSASPWAASASRRRSPRSRCFWHPTRRAISPDRRISSTAAWRSELIPPICRGAERPRQRPATAYYFSGIAAGFPTELSLNQAVVGVAGAGPAVVRRPAFSTP